MTILIGKPEAVHGRQFLDVHLKSAIARHTQDGRVRLRQLHSDGGRQRETHRSQAARGDEPARRRAAVALRRPHLVLSHIRQYEAGPILRHAGEQFLQEGFRRMCQAWLPRVARLGRLRPLCAFRSAGHRSPTGEVRQVRVFGLLIKRGNCFREIADHGQVAGTDAIQLRGIDFKVRDLRVRRETSRLARHAVIQPRPEHHQQVGFVERQVGRLRPVHSHHSEVVGRVRLHRAQAMNRRECGDVEQIKQLLQIVDRSRELRPCADQCHRLLRLLQQGSQRRRKGRLRAYVIGQPRRRELNWTTEFRARLQQVQRNVNHDRTRAVRYAPNKSLPRSREVILQPYAPGDSTW